MLALQPLESAPRMVFQKKKSRGALRMEADLDGCVEMVDEGRQQQAGGHGTAEPAARLGGQRVHGGAWVQEASVQQQVQHVGQVGVQERAQIAYQSRHSPQGGLGLQLLPLTCPAPSCWKLA